MKGEAEGRSEKTKAKMKMPPKKCKTLMKRVTVSKTAIWAYLEHKKPPKCDAFAE